MGPKAELPQLRRVSQKELEKLRIAKKVFSQCVRADMSGKRVFVVYPVVDMGKGLIVHPIGKIAADER